MKSERRHELEQNVLADWLATKINMIKPYQNTISTVAILLVVGAVAYGWWTHRSSTANVAGWNRFYEAFSQEGQGPDDFDRIAEDFPGTDIAHLANTISGDLHLRSGCAMLFSSKLSANDELTQAVDCYRKVIEGRPKAAVKERATFGLARALESQGDLPGAIETYESLTEQWPNGAFAEAATGRIADLNDPATREWYDMFAKFEPKSPYVDEPGVPGQKLPFDLDSLPDDGGGDGSLFTPGIMDLDEKGAGDTEPRYPQPMDSDGQATPDADGQATPDATGTDATTPGPADVPADGGEGEPAPTPPETDQ